MRTFPPVYRSVGGQKYLDAVSKHVLTAALRDDPPTNLEKLAFKIMLENDPEQLAQHAVSVARQENTYGSFVALAACLRYGGRQMPIHPRFRDGKKRALKAKFIALSYLLRSPRRWRILRRALKEW